jgi:hypothetical protein
MDACEFVLGTACDIAPLVFESEVRMSQAIRPDLAALCAVRFPLHPQGLAQLAEDIEPPMQLAGSALRYCNWRLHDLIRHGM